MLAALVLAVDDDDVGGVELGSDRVGQLAGGENRRKDVQADVRGEEEERRSRRRGQRLPAWGA